MTSLFILTQCFAHDLRVRARSKIVCTMLFFPQVYTAPFRCCFIPSHSFVASSRISCTLRSFPIFSIHLKTASSSCGTNKWFNVERMTSKSRESKSPEGADEDPFALPLRVILRLIMEDSWLASPKTPRLKECKMATANKTKIVLPLRKYTSHNRICVSNGTTPLNSVIYHLVAYELLTTPSLSKTAYNPGNSCFINASCKWKSSINPGNPGENNPCNEYVLGESCRETSSE